MISKKAAKAIAKYGMVDCRNAYNRNVCHGEGAHTISLTMPSDTLKTTRQVDAAINAYAEVLANTNEAIDQYIGLKDEFSMLKGILCLDVKTLHAAGLCGVRIAERMDTLRSAS